MGNFIKVLGSSSKEVTPDKVILKLEQIKKDKNYQQAIKNYENDLEKIKQTSIELGLDLDKIKSENYSIDCIRQWQNNEYIDKGYIVKGQYSYEMDIDYGFLHLLLNKIISSDYKFFVTYKFFTSNKDKIEKQLIEEAVFDATKKAKIIANASNVKLKEISNINFEDDFNCYETNETEKRKSEIIEVKDFKVSKKIEIQWNIE